MLEPGPEQRIRVKEPEAVVTPARRRLREHPPATVMLEGARLRARVVAQCTDELPPVREGRGPVEANLAGSTALRHHVPLAALFTEMRVREVTRAMGKASRQEKG